MSDPTPAPDPAPSPAPTPPPVPPVDTSWVDKLDDGGKGFAANKGHHKLDAVTAYKTLATSYQEAERALKSPAERVLRIPAPDAPKEDWEAYHTKLGRPAKADDYTFDVSDDADRAFADFLRGKAFERGLPKDKAEGLWKDIFEWAAKIGGDQADARKAALTTETAALEKQWGKGSDFAAKKLVAMRAARAAGVTEEEFDEMAKQPGFSKKYNEYLFWGQKTAEDQFIPGGLGNGNNLYTQQQAAEQAKLYRDSNSDKGKALLANNPEAWANYRAILQIAHPEQKAA